MALMYHHVPVRANAASRLGGDSLREFALNAARSDVVVRARLSPEYFSAASAWPASASADSAVTRNYAEEERAGSSPALVC